MRSRSILLLALCLVLSVSAANFAQDNEDSTLLQQQNEETTADMQVDGGVCPMPKTLLPDVEAVAASLKAGAQGQTKGITKAAAARFAARKAYKQALVKYQHARKAYKQSTSDVHAAKKHCAAKVSNSVKELALLRVLNAKITQLVHSGKTSLASETTLLQAVMSETSSDEMREGLKKAATGATSPAALLKAIQGMMDKLLATHHKCQSSVHSHVISRNKVRDLLISARKTLHNAAADERTATRRLTAARTAAMRHACAAAFQPARTHLATLRSAIQNWNADVESGSGSGSGKKCPACPACPHHAAEADVEERDEAEESEGESGSEEEGGEDGEEEEDDNSNSSNDEDEQDAEDDDIEEEQDGAVENIEDMDF